jgi:O-antigen ligase
MNWRGGIIVALLLEVLVLCLFGQVLNLYCGGFREFEATLLQVQWMLLVFISVWCGCFIFMTFSVNDLPLIGLLVIAISAYFIGYAAVSTTTDAIILLAGVTLGRGVRVLFKQNEEGRTQKQSETPSTFTPLRLDGNVVSYFLVNLVVLLAFSAWWHLDIGVYHGSRWMGLWDNPNVYGMLMGAGLALAIGLLAASLKSKAQSPKLAEENSDSSSRSFLRSLRSFEAIKSAIRNPQFAILLVAAGMMVVGLVFSYSRGAWVGTVIGLLYLANAHGKFNWRFVLPGIFVVAVVVCFFWHSTVDTGPWYLKRLDLSRPSAQHRVAAWCGAIQMMRDYPLGVGWNKAVEIYDKHYSPPKYSASAITTNDYLMLGTQLGLPGMLCFVAYVALCFRSPKSKVQSLKSESKTLDIGHRTLDLSKTACRAGALAMLVAFWFDGGLFDLPTASVFWILLELGTSDLVSNKNGKQPTPP